MKDFDSKKRDILDRTDLLDLVTPHVALKRSGQRWVGLCPFHAEKTPSFTVRPETGTFKCFGCGKGGDVFSFVQFRENVPFMDAMRMLADRAGVALGASNERSEGGATRSDLLQVNEWAAKFFRSQLCDSDVGRTTRDYLLQRKISDASSERFALGLATDLAPLMRAAEKSGVAPSLLDAADLARQGERGDVYATFRKRLMFPIRDAMGRVIGFGGRTLGDDRAKYLNTRQNALFDKGRTLYGLDVARDGFRDRKRSVVVEGYTDCIAAHQAGFTETVATLGTALTEPHVDLLRRYINDVVLLFDSDDAGEAAADRAVRVAVPRCVKVRLARIPEGKDPSDYLNTAGAEAFSDVLMAAVDALEFKWSQTRDRFGADQSDAGRRDAINDFLRLVADAASSKAVDAIERGLLVNQVAHLLGIDREQIDHAIQRLGKRSSPAVGRVVAPEASHAASKPAGAEQAAWTHWLEVVLNEPKLLAETVSDFAVERIGSDVDQRIATKLLDLVQRSGCSALSDVLAGFDDPADVGRVIELARRGEDRGNYEETFALAALRLRQAIQIEQAAEHRDATTVAVQPGDSANGDLQQRFAAARAHRGYAPQRMIRRSRELPTREE